MTWLIVYLAAGALLMILTLVLEALKWGGLDLPPRDELVEVSILIVGSIIVWPLVVGDEIVRWKRERDRLKAKAEKNSSK